MPLAIRSAAPPPAARSPLLQPPSLTRRAAGLALVVAFSLVAGCRDGTAPETIPVILDFPVLTDSELALWPTTPSVEGGPALTVRATAFFGCGEPEAVARRIGSLLEITARIRPGTENDICAAVIPLWRPIRIAVDALPPGEYRVRAAVAGHSGVAEFRATLWPR